MIYSIILIVGVALLIIATIFLGNSIKLIKNGTRAIATVVDLESSIGSNSTEFTPIFKFTSSNGEEITFKGFGASSPPAFNVGEKVKVVYNPQNPSEAKAMTYFGLFGLSIIMGAVSIAMIIVSGGYFLAQKYLSEL